MNTPKEIIQLPWKWVYVARERLGWPGSLTKQLPTMFQIARCTQ